MNYTPWLYPAALFAVLASSWSVCVFAAPLDGQEDAHKLAPIFHEATFRDDGEQAITVTPIEEDMREWVHRDLKPSEVMDLFDPAVHIEVHEKLMAHYKNSYHNLFVEKREISGGGIDMNGYRLISARIKMNSVLESYLKDELDKIKSQQKAIKVGSNWQPGESLGANINNYAPDNFSDDEIMRLFEMSDKVRQQLASDATTGEGTLTMAEQKAINERVFRAYLEAMAGFETPLDCQQSADDEECPICRDSLESEPAFELPCTHRYHIECTLDWIKMPRSGHHVCPSCVTCRTGFRIPYLMTKDY